jgi:putative restriction endonuclease
MYTQMTLTELRELISRNNTDLAFIKPTDETSNYQDMLAAVFKTACAFLNTKGGAVIIGAAPGEKIIGQKVNDKIRQKITRCIKQLKPLAQENIEVSYVDVGNEKHAIVITVSVGNHQPYTYNNRIFIRKQRYKKFRTKIWRRSASAFKKRMEENLVVVEAIRKVIENNGGIATWEIIFNEINPSINKKSIRTVLYKGVHSNKYFKEIDSGVFALIDYDINKLVLSSEDLTTTKNVVIAIRIGQNLFREKLIISLKKCPITGIDDVRILIASHIKPWSQATNDERLDVKNGFLFSPTIDRLFDSGLISFSDDKELLVSNTISEENLSRLNLKRGQIIADLPIIGREQYLNYHRKKIFLH